MHTKERHPLFTRAQLRALAGVAAAAILGLGYLFLPAKPVTEAVAPVVKEAIEEAPAKDDPAPVEPVPAPEESEPASAE